MPCTENPLRRGTMLLALLVLLSLTFALATQAASASPESASDSVDQGGERANDPAKDPGVVSLVNDLGVSTSQAIRQMDTQVAAGTAEEDLPSSLATVFSDREIQHDQQARVVVAMTDRSLTDEMRDHFASYGVTDLKIRIAQRTDRHLDATAEDMQRRLHNSRTTQDDIYVQAGRKSLGKVTVEFVDGPMNATEKDVLSEARADPDTFTVSEVEQIQVDKKETCDRQNEIECDDPLRGSVWMRERSSANCSAGFNAKSKSDGKPYVLTAGHCDENDGDDWWTHFADGSNHVIGPFHNSEESSDVDGGILRVDNPSGWQFGKPWITVNPNGNGGGDHAPDDTYEITQVKYATSGDRVCMTAGDYPATTCGYVTDTCSSGAGTNCLIEVSSDDGMCSQDGDSGSPYFSHGVAYGIHITSPGNGCLDYVKGEDADEAADKMNVYILTS